MTTPLVNNLAPLAVSASNRVNWADLAAFLVVAEKGSMTGGAKSLGISRPTLLQRIENLETRLRARLFTRSHDGAALTEVGLRMLDHVRAMDRAANAIDRVAREADSKDEGRVRLAAPDGLAAFYIAPRLGEFLGAAPKITFTIDVGTWPDDPVRDELDVSLQYHRAGDTSLVQHLAATIHMTPFASRRYIEQYGAPERPGDFLTHRLIVHSGRRQPENWQASVGAVLALADHVSDTNCSAAMLMAIQAGAAIGSLPSGAATLAPDLVMLGERPVASVDLYLVYHPDVGRVARVRRVIDWLKVIFDPEVHPWFRKEFVHPSEFAMQSRRYGVIQQPM